MFTITFNDNRTTRTEAFEKYYGLLRFVATNKIKDEDFISINLNGEEIVGLDGLCTAALTVADNMEAAEAEMEAMMASDESEEDEDF